MESQFTRIAIAICITATALLAGCGTPSAPNFHGQWKPVNRYATSTTQIPLARAYVFFATPMDGTLKTMLTRWSKDTGIKLSYDIGADYTLTTPAAQIHTTNIYLAASQLNQMYAAQGISVTASAWNISVQTATAPTTKPAEPGARSQIPASVKTP